LTVVPIAIDDCVECMFSSFGGRCQRRAACARDVCVFVDGSTVARGDTAAVGCFDCTCAADGPSCTRRTAAPCPAAGCVLPRNLGEIAVGEERFLSECHVCTCDGERGLLCDNLCHPSCFCEQESCRNLCGDRWCTADVPPEGLDVPDQATLLIDCAVCTCDYGSFSCLIGGCPG
jgi:hypothetical protein